MSDNVKKWTLPLLLSLIIHCAVVLAINVPPKPQPKSFTPAKTIHVNLVEMKTAKTDDKVSAFSSTSPIRANQPTKAVTKNNIDKEKHVDKPRPSAKTADKKRTPETRVPDQSKVVDQMTLDGTADNESRDTSKDTGQSFSASTGYGENRNGSSDSPDAISDGFHESGEKESPIASDLDIIRGVKPIYPLASRRRGEEGTVFIYVRLSHDGAVIEAKVYKSSGYEQLDESALKAVKQWVFKTAKDSELLVPVVFKLKP